MRLLALDTATTSCSVACWSAGAVIASDTKIAGRRQAEILMPMVKSVMKVAGFEYDMLDGIAVTTGPGSFTGVRIGLATARGLALAAGLPLAGVSTLQALAAGSPPAERRGHRILAALDARRDQVYAQLFEAAGGPAGDPFAAAADSIPRRLAEACPDQAPILLVGSGSALVAAVLDDVGWPYRHSNSPPYPCAATIAGIVAERGFDTSASAPVAPLYLREPGVGPVRQSPAGA
jgi:tRNA threonylcarbamoyladenosine biosynthesis protein TsaB